MQNTNSNSPNNFISRQSEFLYFDKKDHGIIVFCGARVGSVSYDLGTESFADKIEKACPNNDTIFIYPGMELDKMNENYNDISNHLEKYLEYRIKFFNIFHLLSINERNMIKNNFDSTTSKAL